MKIKALFTDLDDTLAETRHLYDEAVDLCCSLFNAKTGLNYSQERFRELYLSTQEELKASIPTLAAKHSRTIYFQRMVENLNIDTDYELVYEMNAMYYNYLLNNMKLNPCAEELLKWVKDSGRLVVIVSDGNSDLRVKKIHQLKISKYVDFVVSSEESGMEKPGREPYLLAMKKANVNFDEVVYYGNNAATDTYGANLLGITSVQLRTNNTSDLPQMPQQEPKYWAESCDKVIEVIKNLEG